MVALQDPFGWLPAPWRASSLRILMSDGSEAEESAGMSAPNAMPFTRITTKNNARLVLNLVQLPSDDMTEEPQVAMPFPVGDSQHAQKSSQYKQ
jgi:hypothetical protein